MDLDTGREIQDIMSGSEIRCFRYHYYFVCQILCLVFLFICCRVVNIVSLVVFLFLFLFLFISLTTTRKGRIDGRGLETRVDASRALVSFFSCFFYFSLLTLMDAY